MYQDLSCAQNGALRSICLVSNPSENCDSQSPSLFHHSLHCLSPTLNITMQYFDANFYQ